jgi:hypothetical protein
MYAFMRENVKNILCRYVIPECLLLFTICAYSLSVTNWNYAKTMRGDQAAVYSYVSLSTVKKKHVRRQVALANSRRHNFDKSPRTVGSIA